MKFLYTFILISILIIQATAQEQLDVEKTHYISDEGKIYWPGDQPLYLFASMSPNSENGVRLTNPKQKGFADPLYLDTEGPNFIRSKWAFANDKYAYPKQEVLYEVNKDSQPPVTTAVVSGAQAFKNQGQVYYDSGVTVMIKSTDRYSGVKTIFLSTDGGPYSPFEGQVMPTENKQYAYKFYAVDNVGNREAPQELIFTIDNQAPSTSLSIEGDQTLNILSPRTRIILNAADNSSGVQNTYYAIDGGTPRLYNEFAPLTNISEGDHAISYYSVDMTANEEMPKEYSFYLDQTAPEVEAKVVGDQYQSRGRIFISSRSKLQLVGTDNKAGVKLLSYQIDNGPEVGYKEPFEMPKNKGTHQVAYYGIDKVNNDFKATYQQAKKGEEELNVDLSPPVLNYTFEGPRYEHRDTVFITEKTSIVLSAEDEGSGINAMGYKLDNGAGQAYHKPINVQQEGYHQIDFFGTDQVNNRNTQIFGFVTDNTGPEIEFIISSDPIGSMTLDAGNKQMKVYAKGLKIYLGATDKRVDTQAIYFSINGEEEKKYVQPITVANTGETTLTLRAIDLLGNETVESGHRFFIK